MAQSYYFPQILQESSLNYTHGQEICENLNTSPRTKTIQASLGSWDYKILKKENK